MPEVTHTATFRAADTFSRILEDMICPVCGYRDPADTYRLAPGNKVRFFCDGCGALVTVLLSAEQADVVQHRSIAQSPGA